MGNAPWRFASCEYINLLILEIWAVQILENKLRNPLGGNRHRWYLWGFVRGPCISSCIISPRVMFSGSLQVQVKMYKSKKGPQTKKMAKTKSLNKCCLTAEGWGGAGTLQKRRCVESSLSLYRRSANIPLTKTKADCWVLRSLNLCSIHVSL